MPNDASSGPPASAASAVYSATLVRSTRSVEYSWVIAGPSSGLFVT
jgi:hypothetical protein